MDNQSKLEAVRKAIIKAVPEIMELKFGTIVKIPEFEEHKYYYGRSGISGDRFGAWLISAENNPLPNYQCKFIENADIKRLNIIGRKIGLADVLLAARQVSEYNQNGCLREWPNTSYLPLYREPQIVKLWDLTNDYLDDQSPETIDFLYSLFYSK
jgi:hypothetical protein